MEVETEAFVDGEWIDAGGAQAGACVGDEDTLLGSGGGLFPGDDRVGAGVGFCDEEVVGFLKEGLTGGFGIRPRRVRTAATEATLPATCWASQAQYVGAMVAE